MSISDIRTRSHLIGCASLRLVEFPGAFPSQPDLALRRLSSLLDEDPYDDHAALFLRYDVERAENPSRPRMRISQIGPSRCLTCGAPTRAGPNSSISLQMRAKRARMSSGSASSSVSTSFRVDIRQVTCCPPASDPSASSGVAARLYRLFAIEPAAPARWHEGWCGSSG